jgi:hypothetical protein
MKNENFDTYLGTLVGRVDRFNALVDMRTEEEIAATDATGKKKKKGGKSEGQGGFAGFFGSAQREMLFRSAETRARHVQIIHPSDGHPQEELSPDFNWFRPLSWNNPTWTLYWPELTV